MIAHLLFLPLPLSTGRKFFFNSIETKPNGVEMLVVK